ncbi:MAG: UDP-N-acetylmuramate--alanine ligase [Candidatus Rokubacteria bacterium]|nr:UDP-N-acetylmuramate--alanine ligase [Candidatus Rokubacteria bacterium]
MTAYHFSGIAGQGTNPLARLMRAWGHSVQGSDRAFDQGKQRELAATLATLGIRLLPQDGTAIGAGLERFVYSTAVEAETPEVRAARTLGIERVPRPALLAEVVNGGNPGVAVAGTSGKSTVTGMIGWMLRDAGVPATVLGGAALVGEGVIGCFAAGPHDGPVVAEACESDGTLVGYHPGIGLILNVSRDHAEMESLREQFTTFAKQSRTLWVNAASAEARAIGAAVDARTFGVADDADARLVVESAGPDRARGTLVADGARIALDIPQPGRHNLENAAAAAAVAHTLGVAPAAIARALATFPGVARRFDVVGTTARGIRVVDDYAHNADKIRAAVTTAQAAARVVAVFQPHGFGPARFLRPELAALLPRLLRPDDRWCYAEIFYAGGTVAKDLSSRELAADLPSALRAGYAKDHAAVVDWVTREAKPGDTVLIMGARDPDLPALARAAFAALDSLYSGIVTAGGSHAHDRA